MNYEVLDNLFKEIHSVTGLTDIAYHEIKEGRLNPIHKTNTDVLGVERWKNGHRDNLVYVKDTYVLQYIIDRKEHVYISNTKKDKRSSDAFFFFGVDSILIMPVFEKENVKGIICTVSIGKIQEISEKQIAECLKIANSYMAKI